MNDPFCNLVSQGWPLVQHTISFLIFSLVKVRMHADTGGSAPDLTGNAIMATPLPEATAPIDILRLGPDMFSLFLGGSSLEKGTPN